MTRSQIIEQLFKGKNFCDCINKMEPEHLREDLRQEVILIICELPDEKVHQLYNDKVLDFYTARTIVNLIQSSSSPFYKKYRRFVEDFADNKTSMYHQEDTSDDEIEQKRLIEQLEDIVSRQVGKLHWYQKGLIDLYINHGSYRAIEDETGIPFGSCYKTIRKSFNQIKDTINNPVFTKDELRFIQNGK